MKHERQIFLDGELFSMTLMATVQRANVYELGASEAMRVDFRRDLHSRLARLTEQYKDGISESAHLANIQELATHLSHAHTHTLQGGRFRLGLAQKALNLHLKYLWCLERIAMPPHCPFDAIILSYLPGCHKVCWTKLDSMPEYVEIVRQAKIEAGGAELAEWELRAYNDMTIQVPNGIISTGKGAAPHLG